MNAAELLRRLARPPGLDFLARYPATVLASTNDNRVDVEPDDARLPKFTKIPVRLGLPESRLEVAQGSRVLVAFEGGDPRRPFAELWGESTVTSLVIAGGTLQAARKSDAVEVTVPVGTFLVPGGLPNPEPVTLSGTITGGSSKVRVG